MAERLTTREEEVYRYLLQGLSYKDIARELTVETSTAASHILSIYLKKLVSSRTELMAERIKELEQEVKELKGTKSNTRA